MGTWGYRWIESSLSYGSMAAVHSTFAPDLDQTGRSGPNLAKLESRVFHGGDQWCGGHHPDHQRWFGDLSRPRPLHQATRGSKNKFKRCIDARVAGRPRVTTPRQLHPGESFDLFRPQGAQWDLPLQHRALRLLVRGFALVVTRRL